MKFVLFLLLTGIAQAGLIIDFTTLPTNTANNTYNGYSGGTINGLPFTNLICDDYNHDTYYPSGALTYNMETISQVGSARFGATSTASATYERAALLLAGDGTANLPGLNHVTSAADIASYQYALWDLLTPGSPAYGTSALLLNTVNAEDLSRASLASTYDQLRIYTPVGASVSNQEYLQLSRVPEPGSIGLAGFALVAIAAGARRARKVQS
jgi:hypothetical protein